jgi:hypothetical protein
MGSLGDRKAGEMDCAVRSAQEKPKKVTFFSGFDTLVSFRTIVSSAPDAARQSPVRPGVRFKKI